LVDVLNALPAPDALGHLTGPLRWLEVSSGEFEFEGATYNLCQAGLVST
jgi:hypothetical protein